MTVTARNVYCFVEKYESQITSTLSLTISLYLIRLYFTKTGSKNFGQLTKDEERKLKESNRRISRALRLSKSKGAKFRGVTKFRGGGSYPITPKLLATKFARMTVAAAKDGSIHALALILSCKLYPKSEKWIKTICLGGNTDAIVNEIAKNLHAKRQTIIAQLITDNAIRKNLNDILLELELIEEPLNKLDLFRLAAYDFNAFEVPFVKGAIIGARGLTLMFLTSKIRQILVSELSKEIAKGVFVAILSALSNGGTESLCGIDMTEIEKIKQGLLSRSTLGGIKAPEGSVASNILPLTFNEEIVDFIDIDPVVERLTGSPLIPYSSKFNLDYVIERLVIGLDINQLPRDHITNLW